jgi:Protein of unknown function (DUF1566)/Repeat of unknown function (DUF5648)
MRQDRRLPYILDKSHVEGSTACSVWKELKNYRLYSRGTLFLAACLVALLAACGGGRTDHDLTNGRASAMNSSAYGRPAIAPTSDTSPGPTQWSSYFTQKAAADPYGLIGEEGAKAKASASGFVPRTAYRFYNTANGVHFYTLSEQERNWVQANLPHFSFEGQGFFAVPTQVDELSPVYRFYNTRTGAHFYTINPSERDHVIATLSSVFTYEGVAWYGSTVPGPGWSPIYRFFNTATGTHFYTATPAERDNVRNTLPNFNYEGIGYYVRLSGLLDTTLTGIDANSNGVRDSVEQVLARLVVDPVARQANVQIAASYERVLTEPLPLTREQAIGRISEMACQEESAGAAMYESNGGLASVVFDTDLRLQRLDSFLSALDGGVFGSELQPCANSRAVSNGIRAKTGSNIRNQQVRVIFVNGMMNSRRSAEALSNELASALGHDSTSSNFDYDLIYNPSAVGFGWVNLFALWGDAREIRRQAAVSTEAQRNSGADWTEIASNSNSFLAYYRALGEAYSSKLNLNGAATDNANTTVDMHIYRTTQRIATQIKNLIDQGVRPVLVPHSQGNFFVEAALARLLHEIDQGIWPGMSAERLVNEVGVYGVAPVSATSWKNSYIRNSLDSAVGTSLPVATRGMDFSALPANTVPVLPSEYTPIGSGDTPAITLRSLGADSRYHGFSEMYLNAVIQREQDRESFRVHVRQKILEQMSIPPVMPVPQLRLPHTGTTVNQCYQAGSNLFVSCSSPEAIALSGIVKQDGMRSDINPMRYSQVNNFSITDCVRDSVTGLVWEGKPLDGVRSSSRVFTNIGDGRSDDTSEYIAMVNDLALCGYDDWRLPTVIELQGIVDYGVLAVEAAVNIEWFPWSRTNSGVYWTNTPFNSASDSVYIVDFQVGAIDGTPRTNPNLAVRLVHGSIPASAAFTYESASYGADAAGNVAVDMRTGLKWRRCMEGQVWNGATCTGEAARFLHEQALSAAQAQHAWRIPNVKELVSVAIATNAQASGHSTIFPGVGSEPFWTATPWGPDPGSNNVWYVNFSNGSVYGWPRDRADALFRVRLVQAPSVGVN